jgi:hypothetical protein
MILLGNLWKPVDEVLTCTENAEGPSFIRPLQGCTGRIAAQRSSPAVTAQKTDGEVGEIGEHAVHIGLAKEQAQRVVQTGRPFRHLGMESIGMDSRLAEWASFTKSVVMGRPAASMSETDMADRRADTVGHLGNGANALTLVH